MESEKNHENIPDNLNILKSQNDYIDSKNNMNTQIQLKDNTQDNAEIIQINNNNNVINNNNNNKKNEVKSDNDSNISILKKTTNKNLSNPITNQNINENNIIYNQSPSQVDIVYQQNNNIKEDVNCREKYPFCYWNIKFIFCYNCFDNSEENRQKKENAPVYNVFCLVALFYYLIYIITEIILFALILLKNIFICLLNCYSGFCKMWEKAKKEAEIKRQEQRERDLRRLNEINNNLNDLDRENNKVDRRIVFGNPLNDPGYQLRVIDFHDRKYMEQRESLERERNQIMKNM